MSKIIARKKEKAELERLYHLDRSEFVVVYGRRRVGKTFLVREYFDGKFAFCHTALSPYEDAGPSGLLGKQLQNFHNSLLRYGSKDTFLPADWIEAFDRLISLLDSKKSGRIVVFIDELPWLDTPKSGFLPAFEHFWNGWAAGNSNILLIVCGSATSWIADKLLNNTGGLYGRITSQIKLNPMTLSECREFYADRGVELSSYDLIQYYMIMGGIPYYMNMVRKEDSLPANVDRLFFDRDSYLRDEFGRLFNSLFRNPENYIKVIRLLSGRSLGYTRQEISERCGIPYGGGLTNVLKALEANDFIFQYQPFGNRKDDVRYKLSDPFLLFYLKFVDGVKTLSGGYWSHFENTPALYSWRGHAFENVCFNHIPEIKKALGISGVYTQCSSWHKAGNSSRAGAQIDMLIDRSDRIINLCEMKFLEGEYVINKEEELKLRTRRQTFYEESKTKKAVRMTLITTYGLKNNMYSSIITDVITAEDLISPK